MLKIELTIKIPAKSNVLIQWYPWKSNLTRCSIVYLSRLEIINVQGYVANPLINTGPLCRGVLQWLANLCMSLSIVFPYFTRDASNVSRGDLNLMWNLWKIWRCGHFWNYDRIIDWKFMKIIQDHWTYQILIIVPIWFY